LSEFLIRLHRDGVWPYYWTQYYLGWVTEPSRATPYLEEEAREELKRVIHYLEEDAREALKRVIRRTSQPSLDVVPLSDAMLDRAARYPNL